MLLSAGAPGMAAVAPDRGPVTEPPPDTDDDEWRTVLRRAAEASQRWRYTGETVWIVWTDGEPHVQLSEVHRSRTELTVSTTERYTVRLREDGGDMADHEQGWIVPLPAADLEDSQGHVAAIEAKYHVAVAGRDRLLDRPCARLEVRRRSDGSLRERLWVDEATGLLLRRETYEGAQQRLRLISYLALDLRPGPATRAQRRAARTSDRDELQRRSQAVRPVDEEAVSALRGAGWTVPDMLPGGYRAVGAYAVDSAEGQPLHLVYADGLYTVSLFQQRGSPDWGSLPPGGTPADELDGHAFEWPGAVPQRLVWEASGSTFSLIGDAPPEEFAAIAGSLPVPPRPSMADRLRRGLSRVWEWMSR